MKIQNAKISSGGGSSSGGKSQKYKSPPKADPPSEEKVKNLIISSHCEEWSDEAIPIVPSCHCEPPEASGQGEAIPLDKF